MGSLPSPAGFLIRTVRMTASCHYPFLGFGLGLRADHYDHVLLHRPGEVDWFEIISENFMEAHPGYWDFLAELRSDYPIVMHGVSLSVGSTDPLDTAYLDRLKALADFLEPPWVSDHVCWTGVGGHNTHDLLPVVYTQASLAHMVSRVQQVQERLRRPLVLENPSTYLEFAASDMPEWEFLAQLAVRSGCGLLLDINNVHVNSYNHGYDARAYIDALPARSIAQMHLAGHRHCGTHIIDTHDSQVADDVWDLYRYALAAKGTVSTMVEWDDHIPAFEVLARELGKARQVAQRRAA